MPEAQEDILHQCEKSFKWMVEAGDTLFGFLERYLAVHMRSRRDNMPKKGRNKTSIALLFLPLTKHLVKL